MSWASAAADGRPATGTATVLVLVFVIVIVFMISVLPPGCDMTRTSCSRALLSALWSEFVSAMSIRISAASLVEVVEVVERTGVAVGFLLTAPAAVGTWLSAAAPPATAPPVASNASHRMGGVTASSVWFVRLELNSV